MSGGTVEFCASEMLSKCGFSDGDIIHDALWDAGRAELDEGDKDHGVLREIVRTHLVPKMEAACGQRVTWTERLVTTHNPCRIETIGGTHVEEFADGELDWLNDVSVVLTLDEVVKIAEEQ